MQRKKILRPEPGPIAALQSVLAQTAELVSANARAGRLDSLAHAIKLFPDSERLAAFQSILAATTALPVEHQTAPLRALQKVDSFPEAERIVTSNLVRQALATLPIDQQEVVYYEAPLFPSLRYSGIEQMAANDRKDDRD